MLLKENALKVERRKNGNYVYTFLCKYPSCTKLIRVHSTCGLKKRTGYCGSHAQVIRPFECIYNVIGKTGGRYKTKILSYEEFLDFTKIKNCYYCNDIIPWQEHSITTLTPKCRAYFLDRIDSSGPYSKDNCVVCCTRCNRMKNEYSQDEFITLCKRIASNHSKVDHVERKS
jgi:hypothetical protein